MADPTEAEVIAARLISRAKHAGTYVEPVPPEVCVPKLGPDSTIRAISDAAFDAGMTVKIDLKRAKKKPAPKVKRAARPPAPKAKPKAKRK